MDLFTRFMAFSCDAALSVLLGRWLFVAEGSTLTCYDSYCNNVYESAVTLHNVGDDRILRVFCVGRMEEDGIFAIAILLFENKL